MDTIIHQIKNIIYRMVTGGSDKKPSRIYVGHNEYSELESLAKLQGFEFYDPVVNENKRPEYIGLKIYKVDAKSHLDVL